MVYLFAIVGAFVQQWKSLAPGWNFVVGIFANVPMVAAFAWIATQSDRASVVAYVAIGLFLMTLWNQASLGARWSVYSEAGAGTLEFSLISRSPLVVFLFGKALAHAAAGARPAVVALVMALAIGSQPPRVAEPLWLAVSVATGIVAVVATCFIFAPFQVLAARQLDPIVAIRPFVTVFSGFLYPVSFLPGGMEAFARLLPSSWAMDAVLLSLEGGPAEAIATQVAVALAVSAAYFVVTWLMFQKVEDRVRVSGALIS